MYKKRKYFIILSLLLIVTLSLVGCGGSDPVSDATDDLVYKDYSTEDFSFKYPSSWTASTNDETLNELRSDIPVENYGSGVILEGNTYNQMYGIIAFNNSTEYTEEELVLIADTYEAMIKAREIEPSASFIERSTLNFNGYSAEKLVFEYFYSEVNKEMKAEIIISAKGNKLYLIINEANKDSFSNTVGIFTEIKDSTKFYQ